MAQEAIVINDNYVTPDKYNFYQKKVMKKAWWIFRKFSHYQPTLKLKQHKKEIDLTDDKKWMKTRVLAERNYPIILYESVDGAYQPVRIKREEGKFSREMLNTDKWRDFKKFIHDTHVIAQNRLSRLLQAAIVIILAIFGVAIVVVGFVLLNKFAIDHTTILQGTQLNSTWMNATANYVLGG